MSFRKASFSLDVSQKGASYHHKALGSTSDLETFIALVSTSKKVETKMGGVVLGQGQLNEVEVSLSNSKDPEIWVC